MKKLRKFLAPILGLGLLASGLVAVNVRGARVEKVSADEPTIEKLGPKDLIII